MTLSYNIGLTAGSLVAYLLYAILGASNPDTCKLGRPSLIGSMQGTNIPPIESTGAMMTHLLMNSSVMPTEAVFSTALDQFSGPVNTTTAATTLLGLTTSISSPTHLTATAVSVFGAISSTGLVPNTTITT